MESENNSQMQLNRAISILVIRPPHPRFLCDRNLNQFAPSTHPLSHEGSSTCVVGFIRYRAVNFQQCCRCTYCSATRWRVRGTKQRSCILWRIKRTCLRGCYLYVSYVTRQYTRDCVYLLTYLSTNREGLLHNRPQRWHPILDARFALATEYIIASGYVICSIVIYLALILIFRFYESMSYI